MRRRIIFFSILVVIAVADITGCRRAGQWLVKDDNPVHGDAIIVLMGSFPDKVVQAADMYNEGRAGRLIIVEESMGGSGRLGERGASIVSNTQQARKAAITLGVPQDSITILPGDAQSTAMEAEAVKDYLLHENGTDTIIIVTKPTHSLRATMIFKAAMSNIGRKVSVLSSPSKYTGFDLKHWWRDKEGIQAVMSEYVKFVSFFMVEKRDLKGKRK